jgi:hypothetical protein
MAAGGLPMRSMYFPKASSTHFLIAGTSSLFAARTVISDMGFNRFFQVDK